MLSVILPTYNEAASIGPLIDHLDGVLQNMPHEIIVVDDDSPDGTWKVAESLAQKHPSVRVLRRTGRRGLSSAVTEGFDMAQGDILAVMDADGQHDASLLLKLVLAIRSGAGMAVGSRYIKGGSVGEWVRDRRVISRMGTLVANRVSASPVSDPLSGFFAIKAKLYEDIREKLRPSGFKILLEVLANIPRGTIVTEVPLVFRMRLHGQSKLSPAVHMAFLWQVLRLAVRSIFTGVSPLYAVVFWGATLAIVIAFAPRAWDLRLLKDPQMRTAAEEALLSVASAQGWLVSDIELVRVETGVLVINHTHHLRGGSVPERCRIFLPSATLQCDAGS